MLEQLGHFSSKIFEAMAAPEKAGMPLHFEWRLVRRHGRPFLLVPTRRAAKKVSRTHYLSDTEAVDYEINPGLSPKVSLRLYAAQQRPAKIFRAVFPILMHTPAALLFKRVRLCANSSSDLVRFLAQQCGIQPEILGTPAIKFGGLNTYNSPLVFLLGDVSGRPLKVVKVGLDEIGRENTRREADLLEQLPGTALGCMRLTGRLETPTLTVFATDYFPGESPTDDAGMEKVFHNWLNPEPPVPVTSLAGWSELEAAKGKSSADRQVLATLRQALAGAQVRTTLYHGDFTPWNVRAVNENSIQAFDWDRGSLRGIPGWDWFHFIIQTAILARRLPVERVAAEVEQLLDSNRFKVYATATGMDTVARPLVLSYLLHQNWIVRPLEGHLEAIQLYELLADRWHFQPDGIPLMPRPKLAFRPIAQLQHAAAQLGHVYWEPSLHTHKPLSLRWEWHKNWELILLAAALLAGGVAAQVWLKTVASFVPLYLAPCLMVTWLAERRRLGMLLAFPAAMLGPLTMYFNVPGYHDAGVTIWNTLMRLVVFQTSILLLDRIKNYHPNMTLAANPTAAVPMPLTESWMVLLAAGGWLAGVVWLDHATPPQWNFLALYLVPCMVLTLTYRLSWGILMGMLAIACMGTNEFLTNPAAKSNLVAGWNFAARLVVALVILQYLNQLRKQSVLFYPVRESQAGNGVRLSAGGTRAS